MSDTNSPGAPFIVRGSSAHLQGFSGSGLCNVSLPKADFILEQEAAPTQVVGLRSENLRFVELQDHGKPLKAPPSREGVRSGLMTSVRGIFNIPILSKRTIRVYRIGRVEGK